MRAAPPGTAELFGSDLLRYAAAAGAGARRETFRLPGLRLDVATDDDGYLDLCRNALVDAPEQAPLDLPTLRVGVFDYAHRPEMPRPPGMPMLVPRHYADALDPSDRDGFFDVDYGSWQIFDRRESAGIEVLRGRGHYPPWTASFPLRNFVHWMYLTLGRRILHAGSLGRGGHGVLLAGAGGAGKSGTVLAGVLGGLDSVGDDYVAVEVNADRVAAYPVIRLMKQDAKGLRRLGLDPAAVGAEEPNWQGKYEFDFTRLARGRRAPALAMRAIVMPRVAHAARSRFTRAPSRLAMLALAPSNLQQLPGGWRDSMTFTAGLVRALPAYFMDLGTDPGEIADALDAFIAGDMP